MVTSAPAKAFTDEMLAFNFRGVDKAFRDVHEFMNVTNESVGYLIKKVEKLDKAPSKTKPFLIGAAVGVLVYRAYKQNTQQVKQVLQDSGVSVKFGEAVETVKDEVKKF